MKKLNTENIVALLLFIGLLLYPIIASGYSVLNMTYFLTMIFLSLSLAFIWGFTGIFSFGQTAFFGIGGYSYALITLNMNTTSFNIFALILAILIAGLVAWVLGWFMFYGGVNDVFVGLVTLCVTLVLSTFLAQSAGSQWKVFNVPLGGDNGINNIPPISLGVELIGNPLYYFILVLLIIIYLTLRKLLNSKMGYSMLAIRENRERSKLFGYNIPLLQTLVFSIGGILAGLSGVLYATWGGYMAPSTMSISAAALPVVLVAAAGRKNLTAVMLFTIIYYLFSQYLSVSGSEYALVILGFTLVVVILLVPQGVILTLFNIVDRFFFKDRKLDLSLKRKESVHGQSEANKL
ncbi:branched-chain amino acid ABC transporter permease [Bacillus sp. FJAT-50079]|uniref:branched-chain amino acid ABC transporter permease n=1 Tax=Bacillus sp. FJAT-50079 TaxID=2833577 RepID=UPI001BC9AA68|nr:branched-chain amino acid ABC transporter permease [Bacillus sp. FJAT-50079]MBS4206523.1 urea ABC transporter permease [Bacillus sp. FJAT-50079]